MGSYLSEPVTEKISTDETNDKLSFGASSMQGWRVSQEDAHNCLLDFDTNTSLFSVYDGHGGHEVALYCSQYLPEFLKEIEAYKNGNLEKALEDAFLQFDATIATQNVIAKLKELAGEKEAEEDTDEEENVDNLYEEAAMPIEQVIEKYTSNLLNPAVKNLRKDSDKQPVSPFLKARRSSDSSSGLATNSSASTSESAGDVVSSSSNVKNEANSSTSSQSGNAHAAGEEASKKEETKIPDIKVDSPDSSGDKSEICSPSKKDKEILENEQSSQNGEVESSQNNESNKSNNVTSSSTPQENGEVTKKGKGKALIKTKGVKTPLKTRPKRNAQQLYTKLLDFEDDSEESEEDDKTFEGPNDDSSDDGDGVNATICEDNSEDSSLEGDDEDDEDDEDLDEDDEADLEFARNMREEPGSDSGCTAVVALLRENELYVANAGDSRCIICRKGKAIEMSFDHKPEDEPERQRVIKAGGKVTGDGRVNGGLNLSRAIGDHAYKQNKDLSDREQMITALPDVKTLTINPAEDEFMVLACDGIWNYMSSQEVVDFVRPKIQEGDSLSKICEEMFDHCLAPNTMGDGTGCDNMTAIIVQFKSNILKRSAPSESDTSDNNKRAKTEESTLKAVESA